VGMLILAFGGGGAFLIYRTRKNKQQADASQGWPAVTGQVTEADVHHSSSTDTDGDRHDSYTPHVRYTYQVNGADFSGEKITFGFVIGYGSDSKARAALMKYPVGQQVPVLERKAGGSTAGMIIGIALLVVAFCLGCPAAIAIPMGWFGTR
jgi:hypothetical protein